jgi:hypothetical protein
MAKELPEARQCVDEESSLFGAVAVKSAVPGIEWSVMTPANGGHHDNSGDEVADWPVLAKPAKRAKKPPPEPPKPPAGEQPPTG